MVELLNLLMCLGRPPHPPPPSPPPPPPPSPPAPIAKVTTERDAPVSKTKKRTKGRATGKGRFRIPLGGGGATGLNIG